MPGQGMVRGGAGLGPQHDRAGPRPAHGLDERLRRYRCPEHPGGQAQFGETRGERLQWEGVLLARYARQQDRGSARPGLGQRPDAHAAQRRRDVPGEQVLDLDVLVARGLPLAPHRVQGRHHHLLPGGDQAVLADQGAEHLVHGRRIEADGGPAEPPALLAHIAERQAVARSRLTGRRGGGSRGRGGHRPGPGGACGLRGWHPRRGQAAHLLQDGDVPGVHRRCLPSSRAAGPMPYRRSQERSVVGATPSRRATAPVVIPCAGPAGSAVPPVPRIPPISPGCADSFMDPSCDAQTMRVESMRERVGIWTGTGPGPEEQSP